jgi:hypothetical protein
VHRVAVDGRAQRGRLPFQVGGCPVHVVLTGDALFCQQVLKAGGDYVLLVKANQPTLHDDIRLLFDPPADSTPSRCWTGAKPRRATAGMG